MTTDQPPPSPHWLDAYITYADARSPMTPRTFHEAIGLWLISTTIARRLVLPMPHDDLYPNLWVLLADAQATGERLARVSRAITSAGDWITLCELCRITHLKASQVENTLIELEGAGAIETREVVNGTRTTMQARACVDLSQPA